MTDVLHMTGIEPRPARPRMRIDRRRRWAAWAVAAVAVLAAVTALEYTHRYQPWQPGSEGQWQGHDIVGITDGTGETGLIDTAPPGTLSWIGTSVRLSGSYDVRLLGPAPWEGPSHVTLRWQVDRYRMAASPGTATSRPVTVHPGDVVTLWVMVTRDHCNPGGFLSVRYVGFRWEALGVHHVRYLPIHNEGAQDLPLYLCYEPSVLQHLYKPL